jgi:hypothetical protein
VHQLRRHERLQLKVLGTEEVIICAKRKGNE